MMKYKSIKIILVSFLLNINLLVFASDNLIWAGVDLDTDARIEIEAGNLVRTGLDIEIFDFSDALYHKVEVQSIETTGSFTELKVYDFKTKKLRTFEMQQ